MSCVAIECSYRLNLRAARSLAIDHVSQAAQCAVKAGGRHERIDGSKLDVEVTALPSGSLNTNAELPVSPASIRASLSDLEATMKAASPRLEVVNV
jgi:hypothetical protein